MKRLLAYLLLAFVSFAVLPKILDRPSQMQT